MEKSALKVIITKLSEKTTESILLVTAFMKRVGEYNIVEDNDSPDAPQKMFDAHPTYADEVGIDPSTVIFISLEG